MGWWQAIGLCLVTGLTIAAVGALFHFLMPLLLPALVAEYENAALFRPWAGWTRSYMLVHPFAYGTVFTLTYLLLRRNQVTPGMFDQALGGLRFGTLVFLVGSLPVFLLNLASFNVPAKLIAAWIAQNAVQYLTAGLILGWLCGSPVEKP